MLSRVKSGEEITLTERGEVIARIVPAAEGPLRALIGAGRVQPATLAGPPPRPTVPMRDEVDSGELMERLRGDHRY